jgi:hypothetical protein
MRPPSGEHCSISLKRFEEITQEVVALREAGPINIATCKELGWSALKALEDDIGVGAEKESAIREITAGAAH